MVVLLREFANKHFSTTSFNSKVSNIAKSPCGMDMDVDTTIRGRSTFSSKITSRSTSIASNVSPCVYHFKIECNNNLPDKMAVDSIDSSQLLYNNNVKVEKNLANKIADSVFTKKLQCVLYAKPALNKIPKP